MHIINSFRLRAEGLVVETQYLLLTKLRVIPCLWTYHVHSSVPNMNRHLQTSHTRAPTHTQMHAHTYTTHAYVHRTCVRASDRGNV